MIPLGMTYHEAYNRLLSLSNLNDRPFTASEKDLRASLNRTRAFFKALGNPERKVKLIHIAGTSGKGSTCYLIHQLLRASGTNVGTYLSPHTTSFLERFLWNDGLAPTKAFTEAAESFFAQYEAYLKTGEPLSYFELSTCLSILLFVHLGAEWVVLESGLGGRWDATNVIPRPEIAVITNINKDHTHILGDSLTKIAEEKAGIMKKGGTVLCGEVRPSLKKTFTKEAIAKNAALFFVPPPLSPIIDPSFGSGMQHNAALAARTALEVGIKQDVIDGVLRDPKRLPCRFETIATSPMVIVDGAHSVAKMTDTVERVKKLGRPVHVLFGCTATKDAKAMMELLTPHSVRITTTRFSTIFRKAQNPAELLALVPKRLADRFFLEATEALHHALSQLKKDDILLITGSLYLAGELRAHWIPEEQILKNASSFTH